MTDVHDVLYNYLPAFHRAKDAEIGGPLHDLLAVIQEQVSALEDDITQLYDNWFIETAESWVVPYLGDLLGYAPVAESGVPSAGDSARSDVLMPRREVANTIRYRRRRGTRAVLDQLAVDVASWSAKAIEMYRYLAWFQHMNHLHPDRGRLADMRDSASLDLVGGPFDPSAHRADVRRISSRRTVGRYNIPTVAVYAWRLKLYQVHRTRAQRVVAPNGYAFSALGHDTTLFNWPGVGSGPHPVTREEDAPGPIPRWEFEAEQPPHTASPAYYGAGRSLLVEIPSWSARYPGGVVPADRVVPADLSDWGAYRPQRGTVAVDVARGRLVFPPRQIPRGDVIVSYTYGFPGDLGGGHYERALPRLSDRALTRITGDDLVDPAALLTRLKASTTTLDRVLLDRWSESRRRHLDDWSPPEPPPTTLIDDLVSELQEAVDGPDLAPDPADLPEIENEIRDLPANLSVRRRNRRILELGLGGLIRLGERYYDVGTANLADALAAWRSETPRHSVIEFTVDGAYDHLDDEPIEVGPRDMLVIQAANNVRAVLLLDGSISFILGPGSRLTLDGLIVGSGAVIVSGPGADDDDDDDDEAGAAPPADDEQPAEDGWNPCDDLTACDPVPRVQIRHCTIVPGREVDCDCEPSSPGRPSLVLVDVAGMARISHSITGPIVVEQKPSTSQPLSLGIEDSIVDATDVGLEAIGAEGSVLAYAVLRAVRTTVVGLIDVHAIELVDNCVLLGVTRVGRRQIGCVRFSWIATGSRTPIRHRCQPDMAERAALADRGPISREFEALLRRAAAISVEPRFASLRYGRYDYATLADTCPEAITRGADDEGEMGAWHDLFRSIRTGNLRTRLTEFLPAGMEAGVIFVT